MALAAQSSIPEPLTVDGPATGSADRLIRNIGLLSVSQVITWSLTLAWTVFVPRQLGPAGMSLLVMAWSTSGILVGVAGLGSRLWLVREIAADPSRAAGLLGTALVLRTILILPCVVATALYVHLGDFQGAQVVVLYLSIGITGFTLVTEVFQAALQGVERMGYLAASDVVNKGLLTVVGIPLALLGVTATWLVGLQVAVAGIVASLNLLWTRMFRVDWRLTRQRARSFLASSLAFWAFMGFGTFYLWVDAAMLAVMAPPEVVGWYGVPTRIFQTMIFLPAILSTAWLPGLTAAYRRGPDYLHAAAKRPLQVVTALSLPLAVGMALVAGPFTELLYGPSFEPSIPVLRVLAITIVPIYVNIMVNQVLIASNRQAIWTWVMAGAAVLNPAMNLVLIRYFQAHSGNGAVGAAISLLATESLMLVVGVWLIRRCLDLSDLARIGRALLATGGMAVAVEMVARRGLAAEVAVGAAAFCVLALLLRVVSSEEWHELGRMAERLPIASRVRAGRAL
jgi:O-antigen/teichoic acid export membrane protein